MVDDLVVECDFVYQYEYDCANKFLHKANSWLLTYFTLISRMNASPLVGIFFLFLYSQGKMSNAIMWPNVHKIGSC